MPEGTQSVEEMVAEIRQNYIEYRGETLRTVLDDCTPTTTDRTPSTELPKIPNVYKRWQPPPVNALPPEVEADSRVKVVFRNGDIASAAHRAGSLFWGDANSNHDIVAYRVIKLESGWIDWGRSYERGRPLSTQDGIPEGLNRYARVQVQLRFDDRPQRERVRVAHEWHWGIGGDVDANDIMRYRVVG